MLSPSPNQLLKIRVLQLEMQALLDTAKDEAVTSVMQSFLAVDKSGGVLGDSEASVTACTIQSWASVVAFMELERQRGILSADTKTARTITYHAPGYVHSPEQDCIVGL
jgi:hypothetical protein